MKRLSGNPHSWFARGACLVVVFAAIAAPAWSQDPGMRPPPDTAKPPAVIPGAPAPAEGAPPSPYRLQRGDALEIRVHQLPELGAELVVRPDGKISVPLLGEIEAAGLAVGRLEEILTTGYQKEYRNPRVTVIVKYFSNQTVYIGGEVTRPSLLPLKDGLTAFQAVFQAGGFKETAREDSVMLVRNNGNDKPVVMRLRLDEVLKGKPDTRLQPFDVLYVPKTKIAKLDKFMDQYVKQVSPMLFSFGFTYLLGGKTAESIFP